MAPLKSFLPTDLDPAVIQFMTSGIRLVLFLVAAFVLLRMIRLLSDRLNRMLPGLTQSSERQKQARTLSQIVRVIASTMLFIVTAMFLLEEIGVNIAPLLAAAGIGGLALGFGAQNLVRDVITGFFLLLEDQIRIGDVVRVGDKSGLVERLSLRVLTLRDFDGSVHMIPNGTITTVTNLTKDFSYAVLNIGISYGTDVDEALAILTEVGTDLRQDPQFSPDLLDALEIMGIDDFADTHVKLTLRLKTVPSKQWRISRELRRRIKTAFDHHGIRMRENVSFARPTSDLEPKDGSDQTPLPARDVS
jgi:small conductance mechanosensitive channel